MVVLNASPANLGSCPVPSIALSLTARERDLGGGFRVRRLLPSGKKPAVGPFLFFDHFGPLQVAPYASHDIRPHPHIGLATVTYLFEGAIVHRDNLESVQRIEPGAINWMTAGRGAVHSERTPPDLIGVPHRRAAAQLRRNRIRVRPHAGLRDSILEAG